MLYKKKYIESLKLVRKTLITIALCCFFGQILIDSSLENFVSNVLALSAFTLTCWVVFNHRNTSVGAALSATVVFLMVSANSIAPMLGTLIEGNPVIETLTVPVEVFSQRLLFTLCLLLAHYLSCSSSSLYLRLSVSGLSKKLSTKVVLPVKSLWFIGAIGLAALALKFLHPPLVVGKFLDGLNYLMTAPFLILLPPYNTRQEIKKQRIWLILYYFLQVVFSFVFNTRIAMVMPVGIVAAGWILSLLTGHVTVNKKTLQKGAIRGIVGLFILGNFADLSTAILIERGDRETRSGLDQAKATINTFMDKKAIADYHAEQEALLAGTLAGQDWQENYVRNPFLARFIQVKFDDNLFYRIQYLNDNDLAQVREVAYEKVMVNLPQPVLDLFGISIDKLYVNSFSIGDEIDALYSGADGGFKTGSIPSHAFALFSWFYPLVLIVIYYLIFSIYHGLFSPFYMKYIYGRQIPTLALLLTFTIYIDISLDGVDVLVGSLMRGIIQRVILYAIAIWIVKKCHFPIHMFKREAVNNDPKTTIKQLA